jgi:hypothetical protein
MGKGKRKERERKLVPFHLEVEQITRLRVLAQRWNTTPSDALRRVLDQAYVGRGALCMVEAGFIFLEHMTRSPEEKKP